MSPASGPSLVKAAKSLRRDSTQAEKVLWTHLRNKHRCGFKFRRQQVIRQFIVDFVCFEARLVIELDGGQHAVEKDKDRERDSWLCGQGFHVLRFWNHEVLGNIHGVLEVIERRLAEPLPPIPLT